MQRMFFFVFWGVRDALLLRGFEGGGVGWKADGVGHGAEGASGVGRGAEGVGRRAGGMGVGRRAETPKP